MNKVVITSRMRTLVGDYQCASSLRAAEITYQGTLPDKVEVRP
jgi:hypothetical protein